MDLLFSEQLMLRTPALSYADYSLAKFRTLLNSEFFKKALLIANPVFFNLLAAKRFDISQISQKELNTLIKYYNRASYRSTPMGLFAAFTVTHWGADEHLQLKEASDLKLKLLLDQKLVNHFANVLNGHGDTQSTYQLNPYIYAVYKEYRFVKTAVADDGNKLIFGIEALEINSFTKQLIKWLAKEKERSRESILDFIITHADCEVDEAIDYLSFLSEAQILKPSSSVNITGEDFIKSLVASTPPYFAKTGLAAIVKDMENSAVSSQQVLEMERRLATLTGGAAAGKSSFYAVTERPVINGSINHNHQQQILKGLSVLQLISGQQTSSSNLNEFIKKFKKQYDQQKVPLLHALDPEVGIGYGNVAKAAQDLLPQNAWVKNSDDQQQHLQWSAVNRMFMEKFCLPRGPAEPIRLTAYDIGKLPQKTNGRLPPSMPVMFRIYDNDLFIESAGGVSAQALIARFSMFSDDAKNLCERIANTEQLTNPEVLFAEIAQLSNLHVDNINRRYCAYDYEIPINAVSCKPPAYQIALSDLWISVTGDELILESARLKKRIIPRHSSAYNPANNELGLFRLLSDLQGQGIQANFTFSLESLFPGLSYYPRVQFENVILSLAQWHLGDEFIKDVNSKRFSQDEASMIEYICIKYNLPKQIALTKSDQFLVFDLDVPDEASFFVATVRTLKSVRLQEHLISAHEVASAGGKPLAAQFVALLYNEKQVYGGQLDLKRSLYHVKRTKMPGSDWLYLKLFCDEAFADILLVTKLLPLIKKLLTEEVINCWFFIRYSDQGSHIRLRMRLINPIQAGGILVLFKNNLQNLVHYHLIKEYVADSYQPELERYGADLIDDIQNYFFKSGHLVINYLASELNYGQFQLYRFALVTVNALADVFLVELHEKSDFFTAMYASFFKEFGGEKALKIELDTSYRINKMEIAAAMTENSNYWPSHFDEYYDAFRESALVVSIALSKAKLQRRWQILSDMIHMHINRLFTTKQRQQELLVYYFLSKYTQSTKARLKATSV